MTTLTFQQLVDEVEDMFFELTSNEPSYEDEADPQQGPSDATTSTSTLKPPNTLASRHDST